MRALSSLVTILVVSLAVHAEAPKREESFDRVARMERELNGSCNYGVSPATQFNKPLLCTLDALRKRCNKIDDCYVYCLGNDVGENIGGGCAHLCNYGLRQEWSLPPEARACEEK